jgi:hypothetical protein
VSTLCLGSPQCVSKGGYQDAEHATGGQHGEITYIMASAAMSVALVTSPAFAQSAQAQPEPETTADDAPASAGDIIVTAQRREQRLLDTPLAISAFSGETVDRLNVRNAADLTGIAPGLTAVAISSSQPAFSIRGVGSGATTLPSATIQPSASMSMMFISVAGQDRSPISSMSSASKSCAVRRALCSAATPPQVRLA